MVYPLVATAIAALAVLIQLGIGAGNFEGVSVSRTTSEGAAGLSRQIAIRDVSHSPTLGGAQDVAEDAAVGLHTTRVAPWDTSPFSGPAEDSPLWNFGVVDEGIVYRGAQPSEDNYRWLLDQGFRSIVSFRRERGDERDRILSLGFENYLWLNVEDEKDPTDDQAKRFLDFVTDAENWPVLIHCKVGLGRTGTMAALIRYAVDGWPMDEAIKEARAYRGGVDLVQSQLDWLAQWAATHPPACHRPTAPVYLIPG